MGKRPTTAIGGFGLGLIMWILEMAEVKIPTLILVILGLIAISMVFYGGWPILKRLWQKLKQLQFQSPIITNRTNKSDSSVKKSQLPQSWLEQVLEDDKAFER